MRPPEPLDRQRERLIAAAAKARATADWKSMIVTGDALERLEAFDQCWALFADATGLRQPPSLPEWRGEDIAGQSLMIEQRMRHAGAALRMARFALAAADKVGRILLSVEPRLVPLFARSFPEISVVDHSGTSAARADRGASFERVAQFLGANDQAIRAGFRPLTAPPDVVTAIRQRRGHGHHPTIGIAWHSKNARKRLPFLSTWATMLARVDARFVSLQYEEVANGIDALEQLSGKTIERSHGIDQMADLDGFAAQVASVDRVVTISNTTAHMAGALGVPVTVLLDDQADLIWPTYSRTTPFYPSATLMRQGGQAWDEIFHAILR